MRRLLTVMLFALVLAASAICSAAQVPISDMKVSAFVNHCNTIVKAPDGQPFFPEPTLLPQYTTENEKMYISRLQIGNDMVMVQHNTYADDSIRSLVIYAINDNQGKTVATQLAMGISESLGLTPAEMDKIFGVTSNDNIFKTYCQATKRYITVMAGWEELSDTFTVRFIATDD